MNDVSTLTTLQLAYSEILSIGHILGGLYVWFIVFSLLFLWLV